MGERLNDGAGHGRRRAHPDDGVPGPPGFEARLAQALREPGDLAGEGSEGELRALAAFRTAREAGAHHVRTRRRDDWRPRARRHTVRSLRVTLCALVAGLALGGAAFAAIGSGVHGDGADGARRTEPSAGAPADASDPSGTSSAAPSTTDEADRDRPASAGDDDAHCRAYDKVRGRGDAMDSTAWRRLVTAAGGEKNVPAYCAAQERRTANGAGSGKPGGDTADGPAKPERSPARGQGGGAGKGSGGEKGSGADSGSGSGGAVTPAKPPASAKPGTSAKAADPAKAQDTGAGSGG
ncbi:hypothetical protein ABT383_16350 [Streptomyces humidus]|nr:hypothetical protein [Streptomyces humidus]